MPKRYSLSFGTRLLSSTITTALVAAMLVGLSSSFVAAADFKWSCRAPSSRPVLPQGGTLCRDGNKCGNVSATDVIMINNVIPGDTIEFRFTNLTDIATTKVDLMGVASTGNPIPSSVTPPFGGNPDASYVVAGGDGTEVAFQLTIPPNISPPNPPLDNSGRVEYEISCEPGGGNAGTIKIVKDQTNPGMTDPADPRFDIRLDGDPVSPSGSVEDGLRIGEMTDPIVVSADGNFHTVSEPSLPNGWTVAGINCGAKGSTRGSSIRFPVNNLDNVVCTVLNTFNEDPGLQLEKSADPEKFTAGGQPITYSYKVTNTGNQTIENLTVTDSLPLEGPVSCPVTTLLPQEMTTCTGTYVTRQEDLNSCRVTNEAQAIGSTPNPNAERVRSNVDDATITCDPERTRELIRSFINRRVDLLASNEPDRARMMRRFERRQPPVGSVKDGPMKLMGNSDAGGTKFSFGTSLSQIALASAAAAKKKTESVSQMGLGATAAPTYYPQVPGIDVWVEGHFQRFDDELGGHDQEGDFGILYIGADYLISPWFLIGALVQFDWMDQQTPSLSNADVKGKGWMAGPYATVKFSENIFFDARAAWGQSDNDITPFGTYTDSFDTDRWLAKANLTGNWNFGHLFVTPSVGVIYVEEDAEAYVDSNGFNILGQTARLGRLTFGPEFRYKGYGEDGSILEPHISFTGMWDFDESDNAGVANVGGLLVSDDDFRVKIEAGLLAHNPNFSAASFRATVSYDGLGDDAFSAWGGQLWVNLPLN